MTANTPLLRYFDIRGKAEAIRILFEDNGIAYTEQRFQRSEWPNLKNEWKKSGISTFGQVPIVSVGDHHMAQTNAILRHYARVHDLYGDNHEQLYQADLVADGVDDWRSSYVQLVYSPEFEAKKSAYVSDKIPATLANFEHILEKNKGASPYFVRSSKPTFADYLVLDMCELLVRLDDQCLHRNTPHLKKFFETMTGRDKLKEYILSGRRPQNANNSKNG